MFVTPHPPRHGPRENRHTVQPLSTGDGWQVLAEAMVPLVDGSRW